MVLGGNSGGRDGGGLKRREKEVDLVKTHYMHIWNSKSIKKEKLLFEFADVSLTFKMCGKWTLS